MGWFLFLGSNALSMSKTCIISLLGAKTAVLQMTDYEQFDGRVCQYNKLETGV